MSASRVITVSPPGLKARASAAMSWNALPIQAARDVSDPSMKISRGRISTRWRAAHRAADQRCRRPARAETDDLVALGDVLEVKVEHVRGRRAWRAAQAVPLPQGDEREVARAGARRGGSPRSRAARGPR
jgi:hypothetical protein